MKKNKLIIILLFLYWTNQLFAGPCGDVNSDGTVDIVDALLIAQHYVGLNPENFDQDTADVNGDGSIDIVDALLVARYYVGLIPELPGCTETPAPTPDGGPVTYELQAEDEEWSSGSVETNHDGYTGTGFVNTDNTIGEWIEWRFDLSADSTVECEFRYACAGDARSMDLSINGSAAANLGFPASSAWNTWAAQETDTVALSAGSIAIRLTAATSGGAPNMDKMDITITGGVIVAPTATPPPTPTPTPSPTPTPTPVPTDLPPDWTPPPGFALVVKANDTPRIKYAAGLLGEALSQAGYPVFREENPGIVGEAPAMVIGNLQTNPEIEQLVNDNGLLTGVTLGREGFLLASLDDDTFVLTGNDDSGVLYACDELRDRIRSGGDIPGHPLKVTETPLFRLRGPCIGMQKTEILPGRKTYEYPYTPELFPFFYDKEQWLEYLDLLCENRMNTLYLWNGHPFASLVKLDDYPYAVEVSDEVFEQNVEIFRYLTEEANKRGIWLIQMFYNIFVSKPFAEEHGISTQHSSSSSLVLDYNRKSIAKFVEEYPHVGLLVCLGEALAG